MDREGDGRVRVLLRVLLEQRRRERVEARVGLRDRDAVLQAHDGRKRPEVARVAQPEGPVEIERLRHRPARRQREPFRQHADDFRRPAVDRDIRADDGR